MKTKRILALLLALAMTLSLAACGGESTASGEPQKEAVEEKKDEKLHITFQNCDELGIGQFNDLKADEGRKSTLNSDERYPIVRVPNASHDLSPLNPYSDEKYAFVWHCYEYLIYRTGSDTYEGRLAKDWHWEDDTNLIVELYDYIHDWEGNAITASDVVFSYNLAVDSGYTTGFASYYYDGCEVVDDYTVRFKFTDKIDSLVAFNEIFCRQVVIVDEEEYGRRNYAVEPVGTGAYRLKEFISDSKTVIEADDNYWQKDELRSKFAQANVQTIEFVVMTETFQQVNALLSGDTMNSYEVEDADIPEFLTGGKYSEDFRMVVNPNGNIHGVVPNCSSNSWMANHDLRLAVWYALDNATIAPGLNSTYTAATVAAHPTLDDWDDAWYNWKTPMSVYDPEKAKELVASSGYDGTELVFTCASQHEKLGQVVVAYLQQVGINVKLNVVDKALLDEELSDPSKWDISVVRSYNAKPEATKLQEYLDVKFGKVKGSSLGFVEDPELQKLIDTATNVNTYSKENTEKLMHYAFDNGYLYCVFYPISLKPYSKKIADFAFRYGTTKVVWGSCNYYLD